MFGQGVKSYQAYTKVASHVWSGGGVLPGVHESRFWGLPQASLAVLRLAKQAVVGPAKPPSGLPIRPKACEAVVGVVRPSSKHSKPSRGLIDLSWKPARPS